MNFEPCPFCGSNIINIAEGSTFRWKVAECQECGARCGEVRVKTLPPLDLDGDFKRIAEEWNKRPVNIFSERMRLSSAVEKYMSDNKIFPDVFGVICALSRMKMLYLFKEKEIEE